VADIATCNTSKICYTFAVTIKKSHQKPLLFAVYVLAGILALQVPFTKLIGADVKFTLFDLFAPIAGGIFSPLLGLSSVLAIVLANFALVGGALTVASLVRILTPLFATWYFASRNKLPALVSLIAIIAFVAHPIGRTVWYFSLFWTIPIVASYFKEKHLLARALGATFTAHAIGGAAWIWAFNLPATVWQSLIPLVILERTIFTIGIASSYKLAKHLLKQLKFTKVSAPASA
jgi:hypothetical protein